MFDLLPRGAYPQAGLQLVEALRDYEHMLEQRPASATPRHFFGRSRPEFSWQQLLSEFCLDPLQSHCLAPQNWAKSRPDLYVSTYITERDNFVLEVRPNMDSGYRYGGVTFHANNGDFRSFHVGAGGWDRPSNRVLYINLGELNASFRDNDPWINRVYPGAQHAPERQLLMLATRAKLHQLSLYFNCYLCRELVAFGPEQYIEFREASGHGDTKHRWTSSNSMAAYNRFDPDRWAPPQIAEYLRPTSIDVSTLYRFARNYLSTLDSEDQAQTYSEYLATRPARSVTLSDVAELLRCAADRAYRVDGLLGALAVDADFEQIMRPPHMLDYFCRNFDFTEQAALAWIGKYQPTALAALVQLGVAKLIGYLRTLVRTVNDAELAQVDKLLAARLATDESFKWESAAALPHWLDNDASKHGFTSFDTFQLWLKDLAPLAWAASVTRAERFTEYLAQREAEALTKREAATAKRKAANAKRTAARATKKAESPAERSE